MNLTIDQALRLTAGVFILTSVALAVLHSSYWLIWTTMVGVNLIQFAFTNWCPMVWVYQKMGLKN